MDLTGKIVLLVSVVAVLSSAARRIGVPAPLLLVAVGIAASFVPGVPDYELDPELVLVGLLPPLLYAAAIRTSLIDVRRDWRAIGCSPSGSSPSRAWWSVSHSGPRREHGAASRGL